MKKDLVLQAICDERTFKVIAHLIANGKTTYRNLKCLGFKHDEQLNRCLSKLQHIGVVKRKGKGEYEVPGEQKEYLLEALAKSSDSRIIGEAYGQVSFISNSMRLYGAPEQVLPQHPEHVLAVEHIYLPGDPSIVLATHTHKNSRAAALTVRKGELFPEGSQDLLSNVLSRVLGKIADAKLAERKKLAATVFKEFEDNLEHYESVSKLIMARNKVFLGLLSHVDDKAHLKRHLAAPLWHSDDGKRRIYYGEACPHFSDDLRALAQPDRQDVVSFLSLILDEMKSRSPELYPAGVSLVCHSSFDMVMPAAVENEAKSASKAWKKIKELPEKPIKRQQL